MHLSLTLLGGIEVTLDGQPLTTFEYDKVRALLAYLAVEAAHPHRRETLAGLLWPERPERNARQNLSQTLFSLRRVIGDRQAQPSFLIITPQTLQFNPSSDYHLDVTTLTALVADCKAHNHHQIAACDSCSDKLQQVAALYRGEFLAGFSVPDSPAFEEWSLLNRERLHRLAVEVLHHLADYYQRRNDFEEALQYAWWQAELEPWQENAHRQLMRLLALSGQREAALAQYEACRRLLNEELGLEPAAETRQLYEQIRSGEKFSPLPPRPPAPLPSFLAAASPHPSPPAPFVAREHELAQLDEFLDLALADQGRVVFVTGNTGLGKTALMQEFARRAQATQPDLIVVGGNGNAHTGLGDPYLPFREVLGLLTGDLEARWAIGSITQEHAGRLWNFLPVSVQTLLEVGPDLVDTFVAGAALARRAEAFAQWAGSAEGLAQWEELIAWQGTGPGSANRQQSDLFEQYTRVLRTLARQKPLLLLLDDLQWADPASISLLFHLGRRIEDSRILLVGAYRPADVTIGRPLPARQASRQNGVNSGYRERHPLEPVVNEFKRLFGAIEVDLSRAEGRRFVNAFLDSMPNRLGDTFRQRLYRQTGGHPLFTIELLRSMQDRGDLVQDQQDRWIEGPRLDWDTLPARVEAVITERIDRLSDGLRETLAVACVEGETFTAEVIAQVRSTSEQEMVRWLSDKLERVHRLVNAQGIRQTNGQHLSMYRFRHILFQNYLYHSLDSAERIYLHQAVGTALETVYREQTEEIAVQLARHFEEAKHFEKAVDYLLKAGERALNLYARHEARQYFAKVEQLLPEIRTATVEQQIRLYKGLGDTSDAVEDSVRHYQNRLSLIQRHLPPKDSTTRLLLAETQRLIAVAHQIDRSDEYEHWLQQAFTTLGQPEDKESSIEMIRLLAHQANLEVRRAESEKAVEHAQEALDMAEQIQDFGLMTICLEVLGTALWRANRWQEVLQVNRRRQAINRVRNDKYVAWTIQDSLSLTYWSLGQLEDARQASAHLLRLSQEMGEQVAYAHMIHGVICCEVGDFDEAATQLQEAAAAFEQGGVQFLYGTSLSLLGEVYHRTGRLEEAAAYLRKGVKRQRESGVMQLFNLMLTFKAEVELSLNRLDEALASLQESLELSQATNDLWVEAMARRVLGRAYRLKGEWTEAEKYLLQSIDTHKQLPSKVEHGRSLFEYGLLQQALGQTEKARTLFKQARALFQPQGAKYDLAKVNRVLLPA